MYVTLAANILSCALQNRPRSCAWTRIDARSNYWSLKQASKRLASNELCSCTLIFHFTRAHGRDRAFTQRRVLRFHARKFSIDRSTTMRSFIPLSLWNCSCISAGQKGHEGWYRGGLGRCTGDREQRGCYRLHQHERHSIHESTEFLHLPRSKRPTLQ